MTHVVVTGGAGFIGSALTRALLARGDEVTCVDNLHPQVHTTPPELPEGARLVVADVTDPATFDGSGRWRAGDVRAASCDIAEARAQLGWEPRRTLEAGLADLLDWIDAR